MEEEKIKLQEYNNLIISSYFNNIKIPFFNKNYFFYVSIYSISTTLFFSIILREENLLIYIIVFILQIFIGSLFYLLIYRLLYLYERNFGKIYLNYWILFALPGYFNLLSIFLLNSYLSSYMKKNNIMYYIKKENNKILLHILKYNNTLNLEEYLDEQRKNFEIIDIKKYIQDVNKTWNYFKKLWIFQISIMLLFLTITIISYVLLFR